MLSYRPELHELNLKIKITLAIAGLTVISNRHALTIPDEDWTATDDQISELNTERKPQGCKGA